jgi:hypothetical protein
MIRIGSPILLQSSTSNIHQNAKWRRLHRGRRTSLWRPPCSCSRSWLLLRQVCMYKSTRTSSYTAYTPFNFATTTYSCAPPLGGCPVCRWCMHAGEITCWHPSCTYDGWCYDHSSCSDTCISEGFGNIGGLCSSESPPKCYCSMNCTPPWECCCCESKCSCSIWNARLSTARDPTTAKRHLFTFIAWSKKCKNKVVGITVDRNNEPIQNKKYMFVKLKQGHAAKLCNYGSFSVQHSFENKICKL